MAIARDQAVVLTRVDYSETSQVLVLFTRDHGKVRAIAKGIKRGTKTRFAVGIDLLELGQVCLSSRQERGTALATVTEWKQVRPLSGLRESLPRLYGGQYVAEITAGLTEDWDPHPELFDVLLATLEELSAAGDPLPAVVPFQYELLHSVGSLPRFEECVACGREADISFFSSFEGGVLCRHCESGHVEKREVSESGLELLRALGEDDGTTPMGRQGELRDRALVVAFDVLDYHLSHLIGRAPRVSEKLVPASDRRVLG